MEYVRNIWLRDGLYYVDTSCRSSCVDKNRVEHVSDDALKISELEIARPVFKERRDKRPSKAEVNMLRN